MPRTRPEYTEERAIRSGSPRRSYEPETWSPKHEIVSRLHGVGIPNVKIAEMTGLTQARVSVILNDSRSRPAVTETLEAHREQMESIHARLASGSGRALDVLEDQIENDALDERVRQKASFGWLDRAGYTPVQKQVILGASIPPDALLGVMDALHVSESVEITYETPQRPPAPGGEQAASAEQPLHNVRSGDSDSSANPLVGCESRVPVPAPSHIVDGASDG